jgi:hypothetical protein
MDSGGEGVKAERKCGILELGTMLDHYDSPGVKLRTADGDEFILPLTIPEVQEIGKAGMLFKNLRLTVTLEIE